MRAKLTEARAAITTLSEERAAALSKCQLLQQELAETLATKRKAESAQSHQRFSFLFVILVAIIAFIVGIIVY